MKTLKHFLIKNSFKHMKQYEFITQSTIQYLQEQYLEIEQQLKTITSPYQENKLIHYQQCISNLITKLKEEIKNYTT